MPLDSKGILQFHLGADQFGQQSCGSIGRPVGALQQSSELGHEIEMNRTPSQNRVRRGPVAESELLQFSSLDPSSPLFNGYERGACDADHFGRLGLSEPCHLSRDPEALPDRAIGQPVSA